jgi:predicted kinase
MNKPVLVIVTGSPCTGKTTLARQIARKFHLPFVYKDGVKETLFDTLGWEDRQWSKKLGGASYALLFYFIEAQLAAGQSLVVEANFYPGFSENFLELQQRYDFEPLQILCFADGEILFERFKKRSESGNRHPGHVDHLNYDEFRQTLLFGRLEPLNIGGKVVEVDTGDFEKVNYAEIFAAVDALQPNIL